MINRHTILWVCPPTFYGDQPSPVGGLEHLYRLFFPSIGIFIIPTDEVIFLQVYQQPAGTLFSDTHRTVGDHPVLYAEDVELGIQQLQHFQHAHDREFLHKPHVCVYIYITWNYIYIYEYVYIQIYEYVYIYIYEYVYIYYIYIIHLDIQTTPAIYPYF